MAKQVIALGTAPSGLDGDDARTAFQKTNANFTELYDGTVNQPTNAKLSAISASVWAANQLMYSTGANTLAMAPLTAAGRALLDDADAAAQRTTLGLGTAATASLQISTSDAAAGRVMTSGAFGLGGAQGIAAPNNNLNDCNVNATYNISSATANVPSGASSGSSCLNVCFNGTVSGYQVVFAYTSNRMWFRRRNNSVWYDWEESVNASSIGTAATGTLTTSTTDNAAGRVLRVGDHGLGVSLGTIPTGGRLDALVAHSLFSAQDSAPPDWPTAQGQYPMGINFYRSSIVRSQLAMSYGAGAGVYWRVGNGSTLGNWARLFSQVDILGPVSQSGGVPTGAIIERGSNTNGEYTKYADGTMICWLTASITTVPSMVAFGGTGLYRGPVTWTFPATFASLPIVTGTAVDSSSYGWFAGNTKTLTNATLQYVSPTAAPTAFSGTQLAIGRWF